MTKEEAIEVHLKWKQRLLDYINGTSSEQLDPTQIANSNICELGKWINDHTSTAGVTHLYSIHAAFHLLASRIVQKHIDGDTEGAMRNLKGSFHLVSTEIIDSIKKLKDVE